MRYYGTSSLTVSSPPQSFVEPLTLAAAKKFLELPDREPPDAEEDTMVEDFIIAARVMAEGLQNRNLVPKQYDLYLDGFPCHEINLPEPLVSVDLVRRRDSAGVYTTLTADTDYIVDTARGLLLPPYGVSWPSFTGWPSSAVLIRYTSGLSATDPFWLSDGRPILTGMKYLVSHWFTGRLPFEPLPIEIQAYPMTVDLMSFGAVPRAR